MTNWVFTAIALVAFAFFSGAHHDYSEYLKQWELFNSGENPWLYPDGSFTGNAYGPAYLLIGLLARIHPFFPKIVAAISYLALAKYLLSANKNRIMLAYLFSPFFLVSVFFYSDIDVFVGLAVVCAFIFFAKKYEVLAGFVLSFAVAIKFFPIIYIPFIAFAKGIRLRFLFSVFISTFALFAFSWLNYGASMFEPFLFATHRPAKLLSIFRFLEGKYSPLLYFGIENVSYLSLPCMALSYSFVGLAFCKKKVDYLLASILATALILAWYKVGHQQFYITFVLLYLYWFKNSKNLEKASTYFIGWLSFFTLIHKWTGSFSAYYFQFLLEFVGLIHFVFIVYLLSAIFKEVRLNNKFNL